MTAHIFEKINLFEAINKFDVIYLLEFYLDPSIASDNDDLNIKGYKRYVSNHPNNVKRSGVSAYIKESRPVSCICNAYLQECFMLEILLTLGKRVTLFHCIDPLV